MRARRAKSCCTDGATWLMEYHLAPSGKPGFAVSCHTDASGVVKGCIDTGIIFIAAFDTQQLEWADAQGNATPVTAQARTSPPPGAVAMRVIASKTVLAQLHDAQLPYNAHGMPDLPPLTPELCEAMCSKHAERTGRAPHAGAPRPNPGKATAVLRFGWR